MHNWTPVALSTIAFAITGVFATSTAIAEEKNLGKHSQADIKKACNAVGGELLGVSDSGSYGCENAKAGTLILCNKNENCTGYTPARTRSDHNKIMKSLKSDAKAVTK